MPATKIKSFTIFAFVLLSLTPLNGSFPHPFFEDDYYQHRAEFFLTSEVEVNRAVLYAFQDELTKVRDEIDQIFRGNLDMQEVDSLIGEAVAQIPLHFETLRSCLWKLRYKIKSIFLEAREEVLKGHYRANSFAEECGPLETLPPQSYEALITICYTDDEYVAAQLEEALAFIDALIACAQPQNPVRGPHRQALQMILSRL